MRRCLSIFALLLLNFLYSVPPSDAGWNYVSGRKTPPEVEGSAITFRCGNATVQLTVCTEEVLRIRMSPTGQFKLNEPWVVVKHDWEPVRFTVEDLGEVVRIQTRQLTVLVERSPFRLRMLDADGGTVICEDHPEGGMGWNGQRVICRKRRTGTDHFFGLGQRFEKSDLRG